MLKLLHIYTTMYKIDNRYMYKRYRYIIHLILYKYTGMLYMYKIYRYIIHV